MQATKVVTGPDTRLSYAHIWEPQSMRLRQHMTRGLTSLKALVKPPQHLKLSRNHCATVMLRDQMTRPTQDATS